MHIGLFRTWLFSQPHITQYFHCSTMFSCIATQVPWEGESCHPRLHQPSQNHGQINSCLTYSRARPWNRRAVPRCWLSASPHSGDPTSYPWAAPPRSPPSCSVWWHSQGSLNFLSVFRNLLFFSYQHNLITRQEVGSQSKAMWIVLGWFARREALLTF